MKSALLTAAVAAAAAACASQAQAQITYAGSDTQDGVNISYSITTNGKVDQLLLLSDIVSSSFTFSGTASSRYGAFAAFTATNSLFFRNTNVGGSSPVYATATDLSFDFGGPGGALNASSYNCVTIDRVCTDNLAAPNATVRGIVYALAARGVNDEDATVYNHGDMATRELDNPDLDGSVLAAGTYTEVMSPARLSFATAAAADPGAVPEPATWALMLAGFGMVGTGIRTRRRSTAITYA